MKLGFGIWGLGFGVWGVGCGVWDLGFGIGGLYRGAARVRTDWIIFICAL
jgi:hypothetical protein